MSTAVEVRTTFLWFSRRVAQAGSSDPSLTSSRWPTAPMVCMCTCRTASSAHVGRHHQATSLNGAAESSIVRSALGQSPHRLRHRAQRRLHRPLRRLWNALGCPDRAKIGYKNAWTDATIPRAVTAGARTGARARALATTDGLSHRQLRPRCHFRERHVKLGSFQVSG